MTKQQIVAQLCAAKITGTGFFPGIDDLKNYGCLADKIIEMFPEPSTEIKYKGMIDYKKVSAESLRANWEMES